MTSSKQHFKSKFFQNKNSTVLFGNQFFLLKELILRAHKYVQKFKPGYENPKDLAYSSKHKTFAYLEAW